MIAITALDDSRIIEAWGSIVQEVIQDSMGILRYFAILAGSMLTVSEQLWCPKQMVQCSTSQEGSTLRQVSHISPRARMSVQA